MITFSSKWLAGKNFSGRSNWLSERRIRNPWPKCVFVGPNPETAFTGLSNKVHEELVIASGRAALDISRITSLLDTFQLHGLLTRRIHMLSGGESVRLAIASSTAQCTDELQIDTALEQLDAAWRAKIIHLLKTNQDLLPRTRVVADNHLTAHESLGFTGYVDFPIACPSLPSYFRNEIDVSALNSQLGPIPFLPLTLERVSYWYEHASRRVLSEVSLHLEPGRLYILSGANGSGKTTLVKLLSGTLRPRSGSIRFGVEDFRPDKKPDRFISLAFQNPDYQWTRASVEAQIRLSKQERFGSLTESEILSIFAILPALAAMHPVDLPYAFKKRLSIALALIDTKPWAVFDEPTLGQDEYFASSLAESFRVAMKSGRGLILISHDEGFKSLFPDSDVLELKDGAILTIRAESVGGMK